MITADLIKDERLPGNYFDAYIKGDFESGLIKKTSRSVAFSSTRTLIQAIYAGLEKRARSILRWCCCLLVVGGARISMPVLSKKSVTTMANVAAMEMVEFLHA